jgi:hypothetical protein
MISGFMLSAYSIVANDAIQTLGTFLSSNNKQPWWILWLFASTILTAIFFYGWWIFDGDISYGRLTAFPLPYPFTWIYLIPPFALLLLTNLGIPVSTTFLILTVFEPSNLNEMLIKSVFGYGLAFSVAAILYQLLTPMLEKGFISFQNQDIPVYWIVFQWGTTAFLWSQWLIQDLANIFVYLPRNLDLISLILCLLLMLTLHAIIFYQHGGKIEKIVTSKTNTQDIRSATLINLIYGFILLFFQQYSQMPMSTTWVFLGLLAGRELAIANNLQIRPFPETVMLILVDMGKATIGLGVSIILAFGLPWLARQIG